MRKLMFSDARCDRATDDGLKGAAVADPPPSSVSDGAADVRPSPDVLPSSPPLVPKSVPPPAVRRGPVAPDDVAPIDAEAADADSAEDNADPEAIPREPEVNPWAICTEDERLVGPRIDERRAAPVEPGEAGAENDEVDAAADDDMMPGALEDRCTRDEVRPGKRGGAVERVAVAPWREARGVEKENDDKV